jgi:long-chain acyl-CoA synthetase
VTTTLQERERLLSRIEGRTLVDEFLDVCARNGGRPALVAKEGEAFRTRTWAEYRRSASEVAMGLRRLGVDHGDHVALMMTNRPEHVISDMGALLAGAVPVSVYNTLAPEQIAYIADNCGASVAIVEDAEFLDKWLAVRDDLDGLHTLVVLDPEGVEAGDGVITYDELVATGADALAGGQGELENSAQGVRPEDPVTLIYTSGTTGPPKGVVLTHRNLLFQVAANASLLDIETGQRLISYLPLAHIAERMMSHYMGIRYASTAYFVREMPDVLETMIEARPNSFLAVPRVWEKLHAGLMAQIEASEDERKRKLAHKAIEVGTRKVTEELAGRRPSPMLRVQHALFDRLVFAKIRAGLGLDQLRFALSGAAPISRDLLIFFKAIGIEILEVYGMTETTAVITANRPGGARIGTVGTAVPGTELAIADDGEVLARGPHITPGYHRREDATKETIDPAGWLHTGDLGAIDSQGYLTIIGRKKEMIVTAGGKNLSPTNIEETIKQRSPIIAQICVVGDERPYVSALIVLDAESLPGWCQARGIDVESVAVAAEHDEVRAEVQRAIDEGNEHLARVEQVKQWALVPTEWTAESEELTPSLKLKRAVIHRKYADVIDGLYTGP